MNTTALLLPFLVNCTLVAQNSNILPQNLHFGQPQSLVNKMLNIETPDIRDSPFGYMPGWCGHGIESWERVESDGNKYYNLGFNNKKLARVITYYYDSNSLMKSLTILSKKLHLVKVADDDYFYASATKSAVVYSGGLQGQRMFDGFIAYFNPSDTDTETIENLKNVRIWITNAERKKIEKIKKDDVDY